MSIIIHGGDEKIDLGMINLNENENKNEESGEDAGGEVVERPQTPDFDESEEESEEESGGGGGE